MIQNDRGLFMKQILSKLTKFTVMAIVIASIVSCGGAEERKAKYLEKGKVYLQEKNYDKAKIEFKNVIQIDPKFADAYFYMGQLEERKSEIRKAVGLYKKAIELDPNHLLAKIKLSRIYVMAGTDETIKEAKILLDEIKKSGNETAEAEVIKATLEYKTGATHQAIKDLERIVAKDGKQVEGVLLLASAYAKDKKMEKTRDLLVKAAEDNPKSIDVRMLLARVYANELRDMDAGEKVLLDMVRIEPESYSLQLGLAAFYSRVHKYDKAEKVLRDAIVQDDEDVNRYLKLIDFLGTRISLKQAEDELKAFIKSKPDLYVLQFAQVQFYYAYGKKTEAKNILKKIITEKAYEVEGTKARTLLAKYMLEEGDLKGAKKYVDEVIAEYPNDSEALLISSKLSLASLDALSAINGLRTVIKSDPKNAEASLLLAQAYELNGDHSLAENELKKSIEANPVNDKTHVNYARYLGSKGRVDDALNVIDKALVYFKNSYGLLNIKLKIIASQGKESEVLPLLNKMEQADGRNAEVNILKGKYFASKRKVDKAIEQFELAYKKSHDKYKPLQLIVQLYMANKQPQKAIQRLQANLDKKPDDANSIYLLGKVYLTQKKVTQARKQFVRASEVAQDWVLPYTTLASTYLVDKNTDKALSIYKDALGKLSNKAPVQMQMASIYESKKDFSAAMKIYQNILSDNENDVLAANNYASLLLDFGKPSDVSKALELAKKFEKMQQPALQDTLAWAYAKSGDNAKAVEILKPVVEKAPKIAVFRYHLGYALYQVGDKAAAKSHLEIASSSAQDFSGKDKATELLKSI